MDYFLNKQAAVRSLLHDAQTGSIKHSYIFEGAEGIGKLTAAKMFAMAIHCQGEKKPCMCCPSCKKHLAKSHSDLFVIGEDEAVIKVDTVRSFTDELYIRPALSSKKIFIIKNADSMNADAQNALLKSFEEPPEYAVIILLCRNRENLLMTIRSRGSRVSFDAFSTEDMKEYAIKKYGLDNQKAEFAASYSGGIIGRAISICEDEGFFEKRNKMFRAAAALVKNRSAIFDLAEEFDVKSKKSGMENSDLYFDLFLSFLSDAMHRKLGREIVNADLAPYIDEFSSRVTLDGVIRLIELVAKVKSQLNNSMKYELWIVNMLIDCWEDIHG